MMSGLEQSQIAGCKAVLNAVVSDRALLNDPSLQFIRSFLGEFSAQVPPLQDPSPQEPVSAVEDEDDVLDEGLIPEETEPLPPMGPGEGHSPSDAEMEAAMEAKAKAVAAVEAGNYSDAIEHLTASLQTTPSALTYARRADALLKARRPLAAVRDCDAALALNPDSAKAYKTRGAANRALGRWDDANSDLSEGLRIDYDEAAAKLQKEVLEHQRRKQERLAEQQRRKADQQAQKQSSQETPSGGMPGMAGMPGGMGGMPGGMPGMAGMPGMNPDMMSKLMNDPELMAAMQNPKMMTAMQEMMSNPSAAMKYMSDPQVGPLLMKLAGMAGAGAGVPSSSPAGAGQQSSTVDVDEVD